MDIILNLKYDIFNEVSINILIILELHQVNIQNHISYVVLT